MGSINTQGVYKYTEEDVAATASEMLNKQGDALTALLAGKQVLASNVNVYMNASQTVEFSKPISSMPNGIVLIWSWYASGLPQENHYVHTVVHKHQAAFSGNGVAFALPQTTGPAMHYKYIYVRNTGLTGHASNAPAGGVGFVLRAVVGF